MTETYDPRFLCPTCGRAPSVERLDRACLPNGMLRPGSYRCPLGHTWELTSFDLQLSPRTRQALTDLMQRRQ